MQVSNVLQVESGSPKAILVTSAGEKIALNDDKTYQVADISGVEIIQDSTGSVRFEDRGVATEEEICRYSSIVVPEKGEYQAILSDGTKVWINSDSKLEFPDRFCEGDGLATLRKGDVESIVDWKTGRFNFEDMPLDKLTVKLARWYGVQFIFEDETTKEFRFSGAVTKYRTLDYVLGMIAKTTKVAFQEKDGKILVRKIE